MARYIDAGKLLETTATTSLPRDAQHLYLAMRGMVRNAPTVDVVEVKHGFWKEVEDKGKICSECGKSALFADFGTVFARSFHLTRSKYCPNCGAKMDGRSDTDDR